MEIMVETKYDLPAMKALARRLRKTVRRKHSKRSHFFGWLVVALGLLLMLSGSKWDSKDTVTAFAVMAIVLAFCFEDTLNGLVALRRGIPGLNSSVTTFSETGYDSKTAVGESRFTYENIRYLAETKDYIILVMGPNHGQVFSKAGITVDSLENLRQLLEDKTGLTMVQI